MSDEQAQDGELLRRAAGGSREAVAEIARRYVGFVYAAARRQVRDAHLAEDVTQAVFVILAQKVRRIDPGAPLPAWLFTTTRYAAANATKLRNRREFHERRAAAMRNTVREGDAVPAALEGMLDEALADLRSSDRTAILLSYMAGKSWREVADALGTTEEAARKRVSRAVAQLRGFFARRGVATTAPALVAVMTSAADASVPPALLGGITAALSGGAVTAAGAGTTSSLIAKGAIHMMTLAHVKAAAVGAAVLLGTLGVAGAMVMHEQPEKPAAAGAAPAPAPPLQASTEQAGPFSAQLENGVTVEIVAVSTRGKGERWWNADGSPTDRKFNDTTSQDEPPHSHQMVIRITGGDDPHVQYGIPTLGGWSSQPALQGNIEEAGLLILSFAPKEGASTIDFTVRVAAGEWKDVSTKQSMDGVMMTETEYGPVAWGECADASDGHTMVTVTDQLRDCQRRFVAVDQNGAEHAAADQSTGRVGQMTLSSLRFPVPLDDVAEVQLRARPFEQEVVIRNVSLAAGKQTKPTLEVRKLERKGP